MAGVATPAPVAGAAGSRVIVYALRQNKPQPIQVVIGMSDGQNFEIRSGDLHESERVVIGQLQARQGGVTNPLGGGR